MKPQKNILEYFNKTVQHLPEKIAVVDGDKNISFKELEEKTLELANNIVTKIDSQNRPIAVFLPKSINSVIADIAITYSGNIYMNLDVKTPLERIKSILEVIQPQLIITDSFHLPSLTKIASSFEIINIDNVTIEKKLEQEQIAIRLDSLIDTDPYCIINTSGSTGTPKGVVLNHKSFIDFTEISIDLFNLCEQEIIGSLSPAIFDIYSFELCLMMAKGSTLILLPETLAAFPIKILEIIKKKQVSFIFWVPTIMVNIANMNLFADLKLPSLRTIWFAGEVFPTKQFNYWKKHLPHCVFANLYGPIEITLDCTYHIVTRELSDDEPIPIGIPYSNTDILILNDQNQLVQQGEEGELCVRGTSLAMGYYNNPEKTVSVFVQNPLNNSYPELIYRTGDVVSTNKWGEMVFKGRKDTLIKHLGYRIELGEIEHVIVNILQIVKNCCVVYNAAKKEITAIYEWHEDIADSEFRKRLLEHFPKYMIPSKYIRMEELPRNTNGKIDRLTLKSTVIGN
jgi:amino acid adenylation domain-containing protein